MTETWTAQTLRALQTNAQNYRDQALLQAAADYVQKLTARIDLSEGELDGRIWNHEQW